MKNSMRLITSSWGPAKTFKMIPITRECPYNECIFDINSKVLAVISKDSKESFHMLPKLNEFGDVQRLKLGKKENGKDYAEERKSLVTFYEYYIENKDEIVDFVIGVAENGLGFDFQQYIELEVPKESIGTERIITSVV